MHSSNHISSVTGTRPVIAYTIAVDADGTREGQKSLSSVASFSFSNSAAEEININDELYQFRENSFQNYDYILPPLDSDLEGRYTLTLGNYNAVIRTVVITNFVENLMGKVVSESVRVEVEQIGMHVYIYVVSMY